ncbi:L,D-transpeptidase [Paracoccus yeei]|uniref:L,D-transpeptidase n=1 Tax=Paracoccus yeei TaxID=147645 RepID=UPI003BF867B1
MEPGPGTPLGAQIHHLFQNGGDTLYHVHGACEPEYLGKAVSAGCVRLLDQNAIDLHRHARHGATVRVWPSTLPAALAV